MSNWKVGPGGRLYHPTTGAYVGQLDENGNEQMVLTATPSSGGVGVSGGSQSSPLVISRSGAGPDLGRSALLEMFPLPTRREIMSPYNIDMGASTIPAGVTVNIVDDPLEMYGKALKIDMAPGLSNQRLILKLKGAFVAGYRPKALPELEWRMKPDGLSTPASGTAYDKVRMIAWLLKGTSGYYWSLKNSSGSSPYGLAGPHFDAWNKWRTIRLNPEFQCSVQGTPAPWDWDNPQFEYDSVALTLWNDDTVTRSVYLNSVCNMEHERGGFTLHLDGAYATACESIFQWWAREGWRGSTSRGAGATGEPMFPERWADENFPQFIRAGWSVGHHIGCQRDGARVELQPDVTSEELRQIIIGSNTELNYLGIRNEGARTNAFLRNSYQGQYGGDEAGVMRSVGMWCSRGPTSDATHGFDPLSAKTLYSAYWKPFPGGWPGLHGPFFYYYQAADYNHPVLGNTPEGRDTYEGGELQKLVRRVASWKSYGLTYIHRVEPNPSEQNSGPNFANAFYEHIKSEVKSDRLYPLSLTDVYWLTYARPGDVRLVAGDGAYRSIATGRVAI